MRDVRAGVAVFVAVMVLGGCGGEGGSSQTADTGPLIDDPDLSAASQWAEYIAQYPSYIDGYWKGYRECDGSTQEVGAKHEQFENQVNLQLAEDGLDSAEGARALGLQVGCEDRVGGKFGDPDRDGQPG